MEKWENMSISMLRKPPAEPRFTVLCSSSMRKSLTKMTHFNYNLNYILKYDNFLSLYRNNCKFTLMLWIADCAQQRKCPLAWTAGRPLCLKWGKCIQQLTENEFINFYKICPGWQTQIKHCGSGDFFTGPPTKVPSTEKLIFRLG